MRNEDVVDNGQDMKRDDSKIKNPLRTTVHSNGRI